MFLSEVGTRICLFVIFVITENLDPFVRKIQEEEWWLYKNPHLPSYVPTWWMWFIVVSIPLTVIFVVRFNLLRRTDSSDTSQALQGVTLAICLAGVLANFVKLVVGRPRPDFFYRCYPDGDYQPLKECTGDADTISEGRKSFPSGHSAFSFSSLGFTSLYLAGKLHVFGSIGRGQAWRLCVVLCPLVGASMIALSRTADYHHHWQDVTVGSLLGLGLSYLCYRQYYPPLSKVHSHRPYSSLTDLDDTDSSSWREPTLPSTIKDIAMGPSVKDV